MHGHVILIGASKRLVDAARSLGLRVTAVDKAERIGRVKGLGVDRVIGADYVNDAALGGLFERLHESDPVDACVSVTEYGLAAAAEVSARLGLGGPTPETVALTRDKRAFRSAMDEAGLSPVRWAAANSVEELAAAVDLIGYPLVLKPASGVASDDVRRLDSDADRDLAARACDFEGEPWIAEELLEGPEYSVEGFSFGSRHVVLAITEKTTMGSTEAGAFVEVGHALPAELDPDASAVFTDLVEGVLATVEVTDCASHTEIKLTPDGPRVIETHSRLGGDYIPDLVQSVAGHDLYELSVGWQAGLSDEVREPVAQRGAAAVRFVLGEPGMLTAVLGIEPLRSAPGILRAELLKEIGDEIQPLGASWDRVAYVIAQGATASEATACAVEASAAIRVVTTAAMRREDRL